MKKSYVLNFLMMICSYDRIYFICKSSRNLMSVYFITKMMTIYLNSNIYRTMRFTICFKC